MKILFIHGLGASASWWDRFANSFNDEGFDTEILHMPDLIEGPGAWVNFTIQNYIKDSQTILIGHSLGGAVALESARIQTPSAVICLAIPIAIGKLKDPPLDINELSEKTKKIISETDLFLKSAVEKKPPECPVLYFWGTKDPFVEKEAVKLLPYSNIAISGAGHNLHRERNYISTITTASIQFLKNEGTLGEFVGR